MDNIDLVTDEQKLLELWRIDQQEYGPSNVPFAAFSQWWKQYDLGLKIAVNQADIVGGLGVWALDERSTRLLISGTLPESELTPLSNDQLTVTPSKYWYFSGIFSRQQGGLNTVLKRLLKGGLNSWINSDHVDLPVHCYALGYSGQGMALLDAFGFELIKTAKEMADRMPLYWRQFDRFSDFRTTIPK